MVMEIDRSVRREILTQLKLDQFRHVLRRDGAMRRFRGCNKITYSNLIHN